MGKRVDDIRMLQEVIEEEHELSEKELDAFREMLENLENTESRCLSDKQRDWLTRVHERCNPCEPVTLYSSGKIPEGKPVPTPEVLKNLPKYPPGRKPPV